MNLQSDTIISLSDADFRELVAEALDRSVLYTSRVDVHVDDVKRSKNNARWEITFNLDKQK